ncbi:hypothetical protein KEH51_18280 [[Brevibacterium] frigoritolerans]|uniref:Uncharacterized protein n=1 Tax=Peribacillus frigoritolerans TaxID=450367 RepID=A0A941J792_9BACI|nr:hypothetical protein [Peribacillus frigoritolerans]
MEGSKLIENSILPQSKNDINMPMVLQEGIIAGQYGPCLVKRRDIIPNGVNLLIALPFGSLTPLR